MANSVSMGTSLGRASLFAREGFLAPRMCVRPPSVSVTRNMGIEGASSSRTWKKRGGVPGAGLPALCPHPAVSPFSLARQPAPFRVHGDRGAQVPGRAGAVRWPLSSALTAQRPPEAPFLPLGAPTPAHLPVPRDRCPRRWAWGAEEAPSAEGSAPGLSRGVRPPVATSSGEDACACGGGCGGGFSHGHGLQPGGGSPGARGSRVRVQPSGQGQERETEAEAWLLRPALSQRPTEAGCSVPVQ